MKADLHCHSSASDGALTPPAMIARAAANGVEILALTDHDTTAGVAAARDAASAAGIRLIPGVEISATWRHCSCHVLGLDIDPSDKKLESGLAQLRSERMERAERISRGLAACGIEGAFEGASRFAHGGEVLCRTHFAQFLVACGVVRDTTTAYGQYLAKGRAAYVAHEWADLPRALGWIAGAGGKAVLAHPARLGLSSSAFESLVKDFRSLGGHGIEALAGSHSRDECRRFAAMASKAGLAWTAGSDFHGPGHGPDIGEISDCGPLMGREYRPAWAAWTD